jgi:hypothetical protein
VNGLAYAAMCMLTASGLLVALWFAYDTGFRRGFRRRGQVEVQAAVDRAVAETVQLPGQRGGER